MARGNEKCFLRCNKPEIDLDPNIDVYSDAVYQKGKENLELFCAKGWLKQDKKNCFMFIVNKWVIVYNMDW